MLGTATASPSPARALAAAGPAPRHSVPLLATTPHHRLRERHYSGASPARGSRARARAPQALASLATYTLPRKEGIAADWFQAAVRDCVRHLADAPFLQLVNLRGGGGRPSFANFEVDPSVVAAPELWQGIAEHLSDGSPDVVILVQRVDPGAGAQQAAHRGTGAASSSSSSSSSASTSSSGVSLQRASSVEMCGRAEEACSKLVQSGVADAILDGHVGDCCEGGEPSSAAAHGAAAPRMEAPSIVPYGPAAARKRTAVRAAAISPVGSSGGGGGLPPTAYWGLVVQSRAHTGAEGCYLLKTVRSATTTDCQCTHFSLTRVCQGDHLERQFVKSWLV